MDTQSASPFFRQLPPEIRIKIYKHLLDDAGSIQHIYKSGIGDDAPIAHTRCITDPDAEDIRELAYLSTFDVHSDSIHEEGDRTAWRERQYTDWCNHWKCEEAPPESVGSFSSFLGPMLTCKRMHNEFTSLVYSHMTFSFINTPALDRFLRTTVSNDSARSVRSIHLIWCASAQAYSFSNAPYIEPGEEDYEYLRSWERLWPEVGMWWRDLDHVRIWIYGRDSGYPMPSPEFFRAIEVALSSHRMKVFTIQAVHTREFGAITVAGQEMNEDDGAAVPDFLRDRAFEISRSARPLYSPDTWMAAFATVEDGELKRLGHLIDQKGWGMRTRRSAGAD